MIINDLFNYKKTAVVEATGDEKFDTMMGQIQREPKYPDSQMPPTDVKDLYQWAVKNNKPYHKIFAEWANREGYKSVAPALQRAGDLDTEALDYWTPRVWEIYWGEVRGIDSEMPPEWAKKRIPDELRDYLDTVFDAYDRIVFDWPTEYRQIGQQGVAEGSLNELAPSSGEGGNGPFDYGSAIIEIGQNFVDNYADSAAGEDAADIIQVGKTFMSAGMTKGISALFAIDTQVYGHVLDELSSLGFNVDLDIVSKRRAPTLDRDAQNAMQAVQAKFDAQPGQVYLVTGHHEFGSSSGKIKATSPEAAKQKFIANAGMKFNKVDVKPYQGVAEQAPPINVPPGQQATTQPDGSTRISKPGSVSRADYAKNMAAYKAQTQTPEKIANFKQRMASGQGYTDTERQANLQQQQQHFGKYADTGDLDEQGMAEGRFQDDYPEYGGKDKNKAMAYDRNVGMGYEGEPWSDSNSNWSGDNPNYADSTYEPEPVILQGPDGKQKAFSPDSPEVQGVYDREYGIQNKLGQITKAFQKGIDFNANRPKPYTNLATSDSTNDFSDPIKLGQYDVDFPEQTVINPKNGEVTTIPSPNNPTAPYQKPAPATSKSQVDLTKFGINPDSSKSKSNLVVTDKPAVNKPAVNKPAVNKPAVNKSASSSSIPANPKPGSWQELAKLNNITDPRKLQANTYIKTPDGAEVYVKKGDTLSKLAQKMRPTGTSKRQGMEEDDGFDVVSNYQNMRTTDTGNKSNQTYTGTTIAKNPATGQQKSMASWDYTDPKTGKNYSGSNYIDPQGNAEVQKNYEESKNKVNEVSLGDYRKKATVNKAMAQTNKFFGRDDPAAVAAADRIIAKRERGLGRADARSRPYTAPPVDQDKQRRDLADKYPNIDELVRRAELNRDPNYDRADGQAYYDGRDAEHNYHRLKQIQRMIRGAELDEMNFGGATVNVPGQTPPVNKTNQSKSPSMYDIDKANRKEIASQFDPKSTYVNPYDKNTKALDRGSKAVNTMADFEESIDHELVRLAAESATGINESVERIRHLAGIKQSRV